MGRYINRCTNNANKHGIGRTEQEYLVTEFARKADIAVADALAFIHDEPVAIHEDKKCQFVEAVSREYGDLDTFRVVYNSLETLDT